MTYLPTIDDVVLVKDINYHMVEYFDRVNVKLEVTLLNGQKHSASVGRCYNNLLFCSEGTPFKDDYRLQLKEVESVKIIGYYGL
jgi:hypothetical protein